MEGLIAKLLQSFEEGKMTRRQLIQSLALAATAAPAVGAAPAMPEAPATPTPSPGGTGFKAIAVNHISYEVRDYAKIRDFYSDLLGMRVSQDNGKECFLSFGDTFVIPRNHAGSTPRIDHVAYTIENWDPRVVEAEL